MPRPTQEEIKSLSSFAYGSITLSARVFQLFLLPLRFVTLYDFPSTPLKTVWACPRSLTTTSGIIVYFLFLLLLRCFNSQRISSNGYELAI